MSVLLQWLRDSMNGIEVANVECPGGPIEDGDTVIGVIASPELRRLWGVNVQTVREIQQLQGELEEYAEKTRAEVAATPPEDHPAHDPKTCRGCKGKSDLAQLLSRGEAVVNLFWSGVHAELGPEGLGEVIDQRLSGGIAIRENWQIVSLAPDFGRMLEMLVGDMVGGGIPR